MNVKVYLNSAAKDRDDKQFRVGKVLEYKALNCTQHGGAGSVKGFAFVQVEGDIELVSVDRLKVQLVAKPKQPVSKK